MNTDQMFALVDCNNFFASCELTGQPMLFGKPVGVLSNNDGNIVARSKELKDLGVPMGAPPFQYRDLLAAYQVELFSSNYELYGDLSLRVYNTLNTFAPETYRYSIDEVFLKYFGFQYHNLREMGLEIKNSVFQNTGIPVCAGIAPTMSLSKMANRIAKKYPQLSGVHIIDTPEKRDKALHWTKVEDVWGIARAGQRKLNAIGVFTAHDFVYKATESQVRKIMTVVGTRLQKDLSGTPALFFDDIKPKKNIVSSKSFAKNTNDYEYIRERAFSYAAWAAEKLRRDKSHCSEVTVQVITNHFREDRPQHFEARSMKLDFPTNSSIQIGKSATKLLQQLHQPGYLYKKVVVCLGKITPEGTPQLTLFRNEKPLEGHLMKVVDKINERQGRHKVVFGAMDPAEPIKMNRSRLSQRHTTKWDEMLEINCSK